MSQSSGQLGSAPKGSQFMCPHCDRVIYNRLLKNCEFCGAILPPHLVYSDAQKEALKRKWAEEARLRREAMTARDLGEARHDYDSSSGGGLFNPPLDFGSDVNPE